MKKLFTVLATISILTIFSLCFRDCQHKHNEQQSINLINALSDSITFYKNENNKTVAKISTIETEKAETFLELQSSNEEVKRLQNLLKNNKTAKTATIIETKTVFDTIIRDVDVKASNFKLEDFTNGWIGGYVRFTPEVGQEGKIEDSGFLEFNFQVKNALNILHKKDKDGRMYVEVTDENPYTQINSIRSYYQTQPVKSKKQRFSIGPNLSYGVNHRGEFLPYFGLGLQYNLIKF